MLPWVGAALTMVLSPPGGPVARPVSPDVLSPTLVVARRPERAPQARLEDLISGLAVVRRGRGTPDAPSPLVLFVAVAPLGRAAGVWVIGSF
jgi:hypothetical protein